MAAKSAPARPATRADLEAKTLAASKLEGGRWMEVGVWGNDDVVRVPPFEEAELALGEWWA